MTAPEVFVAALDDAIARSALHFLLRQAAVTIDELQAELGASTRDVQEIMDRLIEEGLAAASNLTNGPTLYSPTATGLQAYRNRTKAI
jgi:predicted ArsR family transcriptional regulator